MDMNAETENRKEEKSIIYKEQMAVGTS